MEVEQEEVLEAVSPIAHYYNSSVLSLTNIAVLEFEIPIDDSMTMSLLEEVFLPINRRFSSIMVAGKKGVKKWKKVEVNLKDHVKVPVFPNGMTLEYYDECFNDYLSNLTAEQLPQTRPLWEIHIVKYPTRDAAGNVIFKLHQSLGDGYSLMGALLSCLHRLDNPSIPLTFPSRQSATPPDRRDKAFFERVSSLFTGLFSTAYDFGWNLLKSSLIEDDKSPIRSGDDRVQFQPLVTTTMTLSLDQIKQIKSKLKVTINDLMTGIIVFGTRLYMQTISEGSGIAKSTALVFLNTRASKGYKSIDEMVKPDSNMPWGNRVAILHVPLPKLTDAELQNPLIFVKKSQHTITRLRNSANVLLNGHLLDIMTKLKGPEVTSKYIHGTCKNTSMSISNMIGPVEPMALANHPIKGMYFLTSGLPQSLFIALISYVGKLRIAMNMEKGFMDPYKFKSSIEHAFEAISKAALESKS